jgi:hypothetical protein
MSGGDRSTAAADASALATASGNAPGPATASIAIDASRGGGVLASDSPFAALP